MSLGQRDSQGGNGNTGDGHEHARAESLAMSGRCELFALGDIVVRGMTESQQRAAAEIYRRNKDATNADLPPR
jgi:hypothetical protein